METDAEKEICSRRGTLLAKAVKLVYTLIQIDREQLIKAGSPAALHMRSSCEQLKLKWWGLR